MGKVIVTTWYKGNPKDFTVMKSAIPRVQNPICCLCRRDKSLLQIAFSLPGQTGNVHTWNTMHAWDACFPVHIVFSGSLVTCVTQGKSDVCTLHSGIKEDFTIVLSMPDPKIDCATIDLQNTTTNVFVDSKTIDDWSVAEKMLLKIEN